MPSGRTCSRPIFTAVRTATRCSARRSVLGTMRPAGTLWPVEPSVTLDGPALAVHVPGAGPIGKRVVRPVLVASLRHGVEDAVDAEELLAAAAVGRVGVEDLAGIVLEEDAVAGEVG